MAAGKKKDRPRKGKGIPYKDEDQEVSRYEKGKSFEQKVGDIFILMGLEVDYNRKIAGNEIDVSIREKRKIGKKYAYYICECKDWKEKVGVDVVRKTFSVRGLVKEDYNKKGMGKECEAIIVSKTGFTEEAIQAAQTSDIILNTYSELLAELMDFNVYLAALINNFEGSELQQLYIQQDFIPERTFEEINSFGFVEQWLQQPDRKQFSLLGDYGTGKTSFAKVLAYNMAKTYKKEPGKSRIPFLVDLRECKGTFSLKNLMHQQLVNAEVKPANEEIFLKLLAEGQILLIFDAFDEMATMSSKEITLSNFKQLNQAVTGDAKVILTSRTHYFRDKDEVDRVLKKEGIEGISHHASMLLREISGKSEYEIVHLKEFSDAQVQEYLQKAMRDKWEVAYKKIESIYNLHDLSCRPVLLDMIVKTLPKIETEKKEFNVVHLYEAYTQFWFEREDHRLQITKEGKEALVEELAYKLWKEGKPSIHYSVLSDIITEHLKEKIKTVRDLETADYEVRTASFLVRDEEGNYSFAHRSFQEFFIARSIKKELLNENFNILDLPLLSKEIVFFFRYLMDNDDSTLSLVAEILETGYRKKISENALFIFYTFLKMVFFKQLFSLKEDIEFKISDVEAYRKLVQRHLPVSLGLKTASLNGWSLPHMVFRNTDFTEASIEDSVLTGIIFEDVVFSGTNMKSSDFSGSLFRNVRFEEVAAHHCRFKNCRFRNCTFKNSDFSMSNFINALFEACTVEGNDFIGAGFYGSNFNMKRNKNNCYVGVGLPGNEVSKFSPVLVNLGHKERVRAVAISKDFRFIVSGSSDHTVKLWDLEKGRHITTFEGHQSLVNSVFISSNNRLMVSGSGDKTVKLWDLQSSQIITTFKGHKDRVWSIFISPDNKRMVSGSSDHTVRLWDLEKCRLINTFEGHTGLVNSVFISPNNRLMVSGSSDHTVKLWDLEKCRLINTFEGHTSLVNSVFISPDNKWMVSGSSDHTVNLWNLTSKRFIITFKGHKNWVNSVFISPDNKWMVSGSSDNTVNLWNLKIGHLITTFEGHESRVNSVFISPDNKWIVSGSDFTTKVWDIKTGRNVLTINLLLEDNAITLFEKDNHFEVSSDTTLQMLYYRDRLALYPAKDFPELRFQKTEDRKQMTDDGNMKGGR